MENPRERTTDPKPFGLRLRGNSLSCEARWKGGEVTLQFSPPKWFCEDQGRLKKMMLMEWYFDAVNHYKTHSRGEKHFNYGDLHEELFGSDNSLPQSAQDRPGFMAFIEQRVADTWEQVQTTLEKRRKRQRLLEAGLDQPEGGRDIIFDNQQSHHINTSNSGPAAEESPPAQPMVDAGRNLQAAPDEIARVQSTSFTADGFANALETTAVNDGAHIMTTPNNPSDWTILETADGPFLSTEAPHMFNLWRKEFETVQQQKRLIKHLEEELKHNQEINSQLLKENEGLQIEKSHLEDKIRANELQWNSVNLSWLPPANYNRDDLEDFLPSLENY